MGYVNDTSMSQFINALEFANTAGTWTPTLASNVVNMVRTAADASFTTMIPIPLPSNSASYKGCLLKSIDVWYTLGTADADDFATVELEKIALAANTTAPTGAAVTTTCDAAHDTAAERKAQAAHKMTVTLTAAEWMSASYSYTLVMTVDAAATTAFKYLGAQANYTLRV